MHMDSDAHVWLIFYHLNTGGHSLDLILLPLTYQVVDCL